MKTDFWSCGDRWRAHVTPEQYDKLVKLDGVERASVYSRGLYGPITGYDVLFPAGVMSQVCEILELSPEKSQKCLIAAQRLTRVKKRRMAQDQRTDGWGYTYRTQTTADEIAGVGKRGNSGRNLLSGGGFGKASKSDWHKWVYGGHPRPE